MEKLLMQDEGKAMRRLRERLEMRLPVRVHCRESEDHGWVEKTHLIDITPFGARLRIGRPTETGRLLHLTMPLPRQLRCYDYTDEQYNIWALVRHARPLALEAVGGLPRFEIGVAFIGKQPPLSFETNPAERYLIANTPAENNLWGMSVLPDAENVRADCVERRVETRNALAAEIVIEVYDAKGELCESEAARTENISRRGMAVRTELDLARGRFVRVRSRRYRIAVIAAVRRLRRGADGRKHLHLEFVDRQWPALEEN
jgi:hypothetical protein